jgi:cytochrome c556
MHPRDAHERELSMRAIKLLVSGLVMAAAVAVHAATPDATVQARQKNFKQIGAAAKAAGDTLKTGSPDVGVIKTSAATIAMLAPHVPTWFPAGTGIGSYKGKTGAKPEIWSDNAGFTAAAANLAKAANEFKAAADSGNLTAIRAKQQALGMACKSCHDKYRQKDD